MDKIEIYPNWATPMARDIAAASDQITITSLSLHPPKTDDARPIGQLWTALKAASIRRIKVRFILPATSKSHPATAQNFTAAARLESIGVQCQFIQPSNLLHAKTVTIDDKIAWIGSGNWTAAATGHNFEMYARIECEKTAKILREHWDMVLLKP